MTPQQILSTRTNSELIADWLVLDQKKVNQETADVRGWYMDEIEKRFPKEFDNWLENCEIDDDITHYIKL